MHCWARYLFVAIVSLLGIGQMITACGQKGDLYLPQPEDAKDARAPDPAPVPEPEPAEDADLLGEPIDPDSDADEAN